jgi:hypothetical protein
VLAQFDQYLAGVGAQYGIDVEAGSPEPNLGPLDTWTGDLPVGAEFEDLDGEKWRVIDTDADMMKAELIADPEQTKTYVSEPDDTGEDSPDEMVRVLDWGPEGPHGLGPQLGGPGYAGQPAYTLEKGDKFFRGPDPVPWTVTASSGKGVKKKVTAQTPGGATATIDPGEVVKKHQAFPLEGAEPGDMVSLGGKDYTVTGTEGELVLVAGQDGSPAGSVHKQNTQATLTKKDDAMAGLDPAEAPDPGVHVPGPPPDWAPFSPKSKTGGGYKFADLGDLEPQSKFKDKSGKTYFAKTKSADGHYVRFAEVGGDGTTYRAPAGSRVKLP